MNQSIQKVIIPKSVTEIQRLAFADCKNLKEVVFENGSRLKTIMATAFSGCSALENIILPEGLENIGKYAFCDTAVVNVALPASLRTIA